MFKNFCSIFRVYSLYKNAQEFLDIQYCRYLRFIVSNSVDDYNDILKSLIHILGGIWIWKKGWETGEKKRWKVGKKMKIDQNHNFGNPPPPLLPPEFLIRSDSIFFFNFVIFLSILQQEWMQNYIGLSNTNNSEGREREGLSYPEGCT